MNNPVYLLEQLKDRILAAFAHRPEVSSIWSSDAKEMYYSMVMVDQLVSRGDRAGDAHGILEYSTNHCEQVASELRSLGDAGRVLEQELRAIFAECRAYMESRLPLREITPPAAPPARVVAISEEEFLLPCAVCGKTAVAFQSPQSQKVQTMSPMLAITTIVADKAGPSADTISCSGIVRRVEFGPKQQILQWVAKGDLAALHAYMDEQGIDGGLDAYCPKCDRTYCREHYNVREEYDEGFYDCSRGTCPQGHSRMVDD